MLALIEALLHPIVWGVVLIPFGLWQARSATGRAKWLTRLAWVGWWGIFLASAPWFVWLTCLWLEAPALRQPPSQTSADVLVLLGGGILYDATTGETQLSTNSLRRVFRVVELYRENPLPIIVSGKNAAGVAGEDVCDMMAELLVKLGVPSTDVVVENRSENTWENARESAEIIDQRGWKSPLIVTSASHLRRADLAFRHWNVVPELVGCDYGQDRFSLNWRLIVPSTTALRTLEEAAHELLGLLYYQFRSLGVGAVEA